MNGVSFAGILLTATTALPLGFPAFGFAQSGESSRSVSRAPVYSTGAEAARPGSPTTTLPLATTRTLRFTTDEGTWISLDVSPDGSTIVFELLGDLYVLPMVGGRATRITEGPAFDAQPRYSPDGKHLVFISDRSGSDNIWVADADGRHPRPVTTGSPMRYQSPEWTPDGAIVVSTNSGSERGFQLRLYSPDGGPGRKLDGAERAIGAALGPDPRFIYYAGSSRTGGSTAWHLMAYDRTTRRARPLRPGRSGGVRPVVSPDGKSLVYSVWEDSVQSLRVLNLQTGKDRALLRESQRPEPFWPSLFARDLLPGCSFTPDGGALILYRRGKIWRVEIASGRATTIPFTADVELHLGPLAHFDSAIDDTALVAHQIRGVRPSPDGRRLAFSALQKIWVMDLPDRTPRRLTRSSASEQVPAWSPDGRYIAYVTWGDVEGGDIYRMRADGRGHPERLTRRKAFYDGLNYSPDGTRLVAMQGTRRAFLDWDLQSLNLVWLPATGGALSVVTSLPAPMGRSPTAANTLPHFTRDGEQIYFHDAAEGLVSVRWNGTDRRTVLRSPGVQALQLSPAGTDVLAWRDGKVYVIGLPPNALDTALTVSVDSPAGSPTGASFPVRKVGALGAEFMGWNHDGKSIYSSVGRSYFTHDLRAPEAAALHRIDVTIVGHRDRPQGSVVLRGARLITMQGDEVIENGDLVVTNNRIAAVGPRGIVPLPPHARIVDVSGTTILPGWIDIHAHLNGTTVGVHQRQVWGYLSYLAYGVTTTRNPNSGVADEFAYQDMVDAGEILGPRILSAGPAIYGTGPAIFGTLPTFLRSPAEAQTVLRRYAELYHTPYVKQYLRDGRREARQWFIMAARELGLTAATEAYGDMKKNLTEAMDGYPDQQHGFTIFPVYRDVIQLYARSGTAYTATLIANDGHEGYFVTRRHPQDDPKVRRFYPRSALQRATRLRQSARGPDQYVWTQHAQDIRKMLDGGVLVALGAHGQFQGLGVHWELEMHADGGIPLHDVLRIGTLNGAKVLGLEQDLGSLEPGKLADLQVLDGNPLEDIHHIGTIRYVMKNGRLYEAATLDEIWPRQRKLPVQWWWETQAAAGHQ